MQFQSSGQIPVDMNQTEEAVKEFSIEVSKSFYFWGTYPSVQVVNVDEVFEEKGYDTVSGLKIIENNKTYKMIWMFITFGMHYPESYSLIANSN